MPQLTRRDEKEIRRLYGNRVPVKTIARALVLSEPAVRRYLRLSLEEEKINEARRERREQLHPRARRRWWWPWKF